MSFNPISSVIEVGGKLLDKLIPDKDLATKLKGELAQQAYAGELQEAVTALEGQINIITTEAQGNWLQRSWRPLTMVWFSILLGMYWFGMAPDYLIDNPGTVDQLFDLLKIGIGGYIVGRSAEKGIETWKKS